MKLANKTLTIHYIFSDLLICKNHCNIRSSKSAKVFQLAFIVNEDVFCNNYVYLVPLCSSGDLWGNYAYCHTPATLSTAMAGNRHYALALCASSII